MMIFMNGLLRIRGVKKMDGHQIIILGELFIIFILSCIGGELYKIRKSFTKSLGG